MKVALVHDYIKEFGGAERVLKELSEMFPKAPIYTAFCVKGSTAGKEFSDKKIIESKYAPILKIWKLYSPLRFLAPKIWGSFDLSEYDLVITSSSWYITRGFKTGPSTKVICYCHTPPRWLYGFQTSVGFTKYLPVKIYSNIVGHFMRIFDFETAQKVDFWIANSVNVKERIWKFYRKSAKVIYPPVSVNEIESVTKNLVKENYFLIVSRLVGAKGLEEAASLSKKLNFELKIVGEAHGFAEVERTLLSLSGGNLTMTGRLSDNELFTILGKAKGLLAFATDEDFGMTVVEAQAAGTPVIAFNGGGFKESIVNGKTGILINDISEKTLRSAIGKLERTNWKRTELLANARRFTREKFRSEMLKFIKFHAQDKNSEEKKHY